MKTIPPLSDADLPEVIIPKENAVFWMDGRGRWCNRHGRFEHKRIIDLFNHSIHLDENGYYVSQIRGDVREKVYFPYEDTPLFVLQIEKGRPIRLVLNTGKTIALNPGELFIKADHLYQRQNDERIKFTDRAMMALAPYLEDRSHGLIIRIGNQNWPIPERDTQP